jgi:phosphatidylglycerol:prolipoprotein diacylglycerol transferase
MINININPVAFLSVRWYGIMVALGILVLILWTVWQVRKGAKLTYDTVFTAALVGIPSGVVFSRLLHVIDNIVAAKLHPELVLSGSVIDYTLHPTQIIGGAGLTIWGAVLGTALGIWIYSRFAKVKFGYLADVIAPGIILAQAIGRVGCTINGCCYGTETTLPWAIIYNHPNALAPLGVPLHPTTVYEIIYLLIIFGVVLGLRNRLKPDGSLFMVYLSLYSVWRLGIDFLREGTPFLFGLHQAQVIGIITLAIIIPVLILRTRWVKREATIPVEE